MGIILDSSVVIIAERRGDTVVELLRGIIASTGDQELALSAIGLTELVHGIYRAQTPKVRSERQAFIDELVADVVVYPYTKETAQLAGRIDAEQKTRGNVIPFSDLLIGATALVARHSILTANARHFRMIPGLTVLPF